MRSRWLFLILLLTVVAMPEYTAEQYVEDVMCGRQIVCKWVRLAVERHLRDLELQNTPEFPYYFDEAQAKRVIDFKQQLRHTKGEWAKPRKHDTRIRLEPWQQFIDWVVFGWRREGGYHRFTKVFEEVGRKNGKTTDGAATANCCFLVDRPREMGPEVYCIATKKDQAKIAWEEAERQIQKRHPFLKKLARTYKQSSVISVPGTPARLKPLGKDSKTEDALNPHFVLVDEYHAHVDNSMLEVMESALGAREQPLIWIITTAGFEKNCFCYQEEHVLSERILERSNRRYRQKTGLDLRAGLAADKPGNRAWCGSAPLSEVTEMGLPARLFKPKAEAVTGVVSSVGELAKDLRTAITGDIPPDLRAELLGKTLDITTKLIEVQTNVIVAEAQG